MVDVDTNSLGVVCNISLHKSSVSGIVTSTVSCDGTPASGGNAGYSVGDKFKVTGSDMTTEVVSVNIVDSGFDYVANQELSISPADGNNAVLKIGSVESDGSISSLIVTTKGCGFVYAETCLNNCTFVPSGGSGSGARVEISNLGDSFQEVTRTSKSETFNAFNQVLVGTDEIQI